MRLLNKEPTVSRGDPAIIAALEQWPEPVPVTVRLCSIVGDPTAVAGGWYATFRVLNEEHWEEQVTGVQPAATFIGVTGLPWDFWGEQDPLWLVLTPTPDGYLEIIDFRYAEIVSEAEYFQASMLDLLARTSR